MKAIELVTQTESEILALSEKGDPFSVERAVLSALTKIFKEIQVQTKVRANVGSKISLWREGFKKWQAYCTRIEDLRKHEFISPALFLLCVSKLNPSLYVLLVENGVFFSYRISAKEKADYQEFCVKVFKAMTPEQHEEMDLRGK